MKRPKESMPVDREAVLERLRREMVETFDVGFVVCSWEEAGQTYHAHTQWGNQYAVENLSGQAKEILYPEENIEI